MTSPDSTGVTMAVDNSTEDWQDSLLTTDNVQSLGWTGNFIVGIYLCVIGVLSVTGNGVVMTVLWRCKKTRHKPHNTLLLNMAAADLLVSVVGYPFTTISAFRGRYVFGAEVCALQGFLTFLLALVAMTSLVFLSLYRYIAVCRPWLKYRITVSVSRRSVLVVWGYALFWTLPPLLGWSRYTLELFGTACSVDWTSRREADIIYIYCLVLFCYVLPVLIMSACYWRIVRTALGLRYVSPQVWDLHQAICHYDLTVEVKLSGLCLLMVVFFMAVWSPYAVVSLWSLYQDLPVWAIALPTLFAKLASSLNPYIYAMLSPQFRRHLTPHTPPCRRCCCCCLCRCCRDGNAVGPLSRVVEERGAGIYTIDRTKDDVYIGQRTVMIHSQEVAMF